MNAFLRICALAVLLVIGLLPARADEAPVTDPARVSQHLHQTLARPEFEDASDNPASPQIEDLLSQWFKRLGAKIGEFKYASRMPAFETMLMSLLVIFSIGVLLYIMTRLSKHRAWIDSGRNEPANAPATLRPPEFYEDEIDRAVKASDWHAAWLAAWRQFLSRLEQRSLVEADRTRTNREYLRQLRDQPLPVAVVDLLTRTVDAYDRFIYGRAAIGESEWTAFRGQLEEAALLLHLNDKRAAAP